MTGRECPGTAQAVERGNSRRRFAGKDPQKEKKTPTPKTQKKDQKPKKKKSVLNLSPELFE